MPAEYLIGFLILLVAAILVVLLLPLIVKLGKSFLALLKHQIKEAGKVAENKKDKSEMKSERGQAGVAVALVVLGVAVLIAGGVLVTSYHRVDAGQVGIIVDYPAGTVAGEPRVSVAQTGIVYWIWPLELKKWQTYPVSQQTYVMVRSEKEGKVIGDDSIRCRGRDGIPFYVDSGTLWRADPLRAGNLYLKRPNVALTGGGQDDIEDQIVRQAIRSGTTDACSFYTYDEVYGAKRLEFGKKAAEIVGGKLDASYIILDEFQLREVHLEPEQAAAISKVAAAQQAAKEAAFLKEKAENEARGVIAKAEGEKQAKILAAQADAEAIRIINEQLSTSGYYISFQYAKSWNGAYPTTVVLANGQSLPIFAGLQIPSVTPTPNTPVK